MDDLISDFIAETRETLEAITGEIVAWEADPADGARLDAIFRFVHTVKGSCGFLDLPRLQHLSHRAEDALAQVREGSRTPDAALVSAVLAVLDRIGELTELLGTEGEIPAGGDDERLIAALAPAQAAEAEPVTAPVATPVRAVARSIRLPVDLLDRMMAGVSDMVLARNELSRAFRDIPAMAPAELAFERLSQCVAEVRDAITRSRMTRIDGLFSSLPRMVRDLAAQLGRRVTLELDGGDVELDREMIEMIRDPLTHVVRNAIDHGVEPPADRVLAGKPAIGRLRISARQSGNQILINAIDDGRGIDPDALIRKAIMAGLIKPDEAERLSSARVLDLIFSPGLSTARRVTDISGRGVGLDVVRSNIERIGGTVDVESRFGHGMRLTMRVPLTLTIIPAIIVDSGGQRYAVPRAAIDEIVGLSSGAATLRKMGDALIAEVRSRTLPVIDLSAMLGRERIGPDGSAPVLVILRSGAGERFALKVDAVVDHEELVVKPAAPALMATGLYAGTTLPDNSRPMLLLDVAGLAAAGGVTLQSEPAAPETEDAVAALLPTLLFRDLDGADRAVRLGIVERIEDVERAQVSETASGLHLAQRGEIVPLVLCGALPAEGRLRVLRLGDGNTHLAYAIDRVIDVIDLAEDFVAARVPGPIAGLCLVGERQVELLDAHWLFAGGAPAATRATTCLVMDGEDGWARQVLAPLLGAAGYRLRYGGADQPVAAGEVRVTCGAAPAATGPAPVVRLRAEAIPAGAGDDTIWRYDRAGVLAAVRAATGG